MKFFFDATCLAEGTSIDTTPAYIEITKSVSEPLGSSFLYLMPGPIPYSITIAACWGNELDGWLPLLSDTERSGDWLKFLSATYPAFGRFLGASATEQLGVPSLSRDVDPDTMSHKWFVTITVGNISPPDVVTLEAVRDFLQDPRLIKAYRTILNESLTAAHELLNNRPNNSDVAAIFGKEYIRSQIRALQTFNKWMPTLTNIFTLGN